MRDINGLEDVVGFEPEHYARRASHRDRTAIRCGEKSLTWTQLATRVHRLARAWELRGFDRGTTVATFMPNCVEVVEVMYSLGRAAMVNATVNAKFMADEFVRTVEYSDAAALVVSAKMLPVVDAAMIRLPHLDRSNVFVVDGESIDHAYSDYEDLVASGDDEPMGRVPDELDTLWMAFTGGTTGVAKACMCPHRGIVHLWHTMYQEMGIRRTDKGLIASSLNHALGNYFGMALLHLGGTLIVLPDFDPVAVLETIEAEKITFIPSAPSLHTMILDAADAADAAGGSHDLSSVRLTIVGGAPLSTTTKTRLLARFADAELVCGYGGTESGLFAIVSPEDQLRLERSAGLPPLGMELRILDEDGRECPPGQVGTIYGRGHHTAVEYYKQPEATAAQWQGDWYTLDDMGYLDEDGYLYVTDRRKNMIVSSGINVFPAEVESVLAAHPAVVEAAVIGIPDEKWGEVVCAFVVVRPGALVTSDDLDAHCREHLARYKVPRRFEFRDDLPRTFAGKLSHRDLRAPFWDGQATRV